jgi:diguanylate cyclase (GGDEF)-like protein/PAS domain S-box-containing protein
MSQRIPSKTSAAAPAGAARTSVPDSVTFGLCVFDVDARLIVCNDRYLEMYGLARTDIKPDTTLVDLLEMRQGNRSFEGDAKNFAVAIMSAVRARRTLSHVSELPNGRIVSIVNEPMPGGGWVSTHEDVTDRKRAERELDNTRNFLDTVVNNIPISLFVQDMHSVRLLLANQAAADMFGVPRESLIGKTAHDLLPKEEADFVTAHDREVMESGNLVALGEHWVHTANGTRLMSTKKLVVPNAKGEPQYLLSMAEDVTERKRAEERIAYMAHHDTLTELPNRAAFTDRLIATLERAKDEKISFALLCVDFDRFKEVNDVFGHAIGDELLRRLSKRMQALASGAFLARLGGDEFMIVAANGAQPTTAAALADRLLASSEEEIEIDGNSLRVGLSIGVAIYPNDGEDATTLLGNADAALYRAKNEGRGLIRFFESDMDERLRERRSLQHDLRRALERDELSLHYQPQARMDGEIVGFEALVRWQHPGHGMIPPNTFIPIAEESGLIIQIGEWILREACREASTWKRPLQIAINLSPIQFQHGDLPALVHSALLETGLAARRVELEITEGVLINDFSRAVSILRRLKALGVRIAMDDFGTGYSSLAYLQSFPFDKIKIDQAFISNLEGNPQSAAIVRAVIGLGHGLDLPVIAEGVETAGQLAFLTREACNEVQGYFVGRPMPISEYAELVGNPPVERKKHAAAQ